MVSIRGIRGKRGYAIVNGRRVNMRDRSHKPADGFVWHEKAARSFKTKDGRVVNIPKKGKWVMGDELKSKLPAAFRSRIKR